MNKRFLLLILNLNTFTNQSRKYIFKIPERREYIKDQTLTRHLCHPNPEPAGSIQQTFSVHQPLAATDCRLAARGKKIRQQNSFLINKYIYRYLEIYFYNKNTFDDQNTVGTLLEKSKIDF